MLRAADGKQAITVPFFVVLDSDTVRQRAHAFCPAFLFFEERQISSVPNGTGAPHRADTEE